MGWLGEKFIWDLNGLKKKEKKVTNNSKQMAESVEPHEW